MRGAEVRDRLSGDAVSVEARAVVNATGPWLETMRRLEEPGVAPYGQLSKGVHVTLPLDEPWSAALTIPHDQVRVTFAYPWEGMLLLGTTDTPYEGDPAAVTATDGDVDRVLAEAAVAVDSRLLRRANVLSTYAGLRVLPAQRRLDCGRPPRDGIPGGKGGMLTVAGGKLTTYRRIALDALDHLSAELGLSQRRPAAGSASRRNRCGQRRRAHRHRLGPRAAGRRTPRPFLRLRADRVVGLAAERPSSSSACTLMRRTSLLRSCSPPGRSGRRAPTTSCSDGLPWRSRGLATPAVVARVTELLGQP